jgi:hypothetical protein
MTEYRFFWIFFKVVITFILIMAVMGDFIMYQCINELVQERRDMTAAIESCNQWTTDHFVIVPDKICTSKRPINYIYLRGRNGK